MKLGICHAAVGPSIALVVRPDNKRPATPRRIEMIAHHPPHHHFACWDTWVYVPLCALLTLAALVVGSRES